MTDAAQPLPRTPSASHTPHAQRPRRTRHPAAGSRRAVAGLATALGFGLVTAMSWPSAAVDAPLLASSPAAVPQDAVPTTAELVAAAGARATDTVAVRVVVRRHHAAPVEAPPVRFVQAQPTRSAPSTSAAPAPAPRPAPRPRTRSGGS